MKDDDNFISRWSRRKIAVRKGETVEAESVKPTPEAGRAAPTAGVVPEPSGSQKAQAPMELPPIDSLTIDSDFTAFLQPGVDPGLKREALKKLVRDPRFNVMDGLDVYIDDYSKPDPLPDGWLEKLNQMKHLGHYLEPKEGDAPPSQETIDAQPVDELRKTIEPQPGDRPTSDPESAPAGPAAADEERRDSE